MSNNSIFGEKQIALYNYDATYKKVEGLINKYKTYKSKIDSFYASLGSTSKRYYEKVSMTKSREAEDFKKVEKIINYKNFIEYCDIIVKANIEKLDAYEKLVFDEIIMGGNKMSVIENDARYNHSHGYLIRVKKSCIIKIAMWFDLDVLKDSLESELERFKDYCF